jgi:hypothetical protein
MRSAMYLDTPIAHDVDERDVAEAYPSKRLDGGFDLQLYLVTGIEEAEIDFGSLEHEPENTIVVSAEPKEKDDTLFG